MILAKKRNFGGGKFRFFARALEVYIARHPAVHCILGWIRRDSGRARVDIDASTHTAAGRVRAACGRMPSLIEKTWQLSLGANP